MLARAALIGLAILVVGLIVGAAGAATPVGTAGTGTVTLLNTPIRVAPNDYASQNTALTQGKNVTFSMSIANLTVFTFYIMNQSQYYNYYGCAPFCHAATFVAPPVNGSVPVTPLANFVNITVTPSAPYSKPFVAPSNGTYYFVFDNTVGPSWKTYMGQNATGPTTGSFSLTTIGPVTNYSANWPFVGGGAALLIVGGVITTMMWEAKKPQSS